MIELLEDTSILIVNKLQERTLPLENLTQLLTIGISQKNELIKSVNPGEKPAYPAKGIMPPQPEAYIKYPRYDFL